MTKAHSRLSSLAGLIAGATLATGCFTPANYGGEAAEEHAEPTLTVVPPSLPASEEKIVEGIVPSSEGKKLEIKAPEIPYEAPFDGKPLSSKVLDDGVVIEEFVLGSEGDEVAENKMVEFAFKGYAGANGRQIMGSRMAPAKMSINEATRKRDVIAAAMADAMLGMKAGGKRRVMVPAAIVEEGAPPGRPVIGDLWMTVEVVSVADAPVLHGPEAYAGTPVASKKLDNGVEIYDYVAGEGRAAKQGDQVITHYIGQLTDGTEFDSSHSRAEGLPVNIGGGGVIKGFSEGLVGAKAGMLRKVVIPPELAYGERAQGKIPPNSTLVFMLQVTSVTEGGGTPPGGHGPGDGHGH
ncbi:MAG: FKBP-type peptidyl-prolyl cis-trans isomerase [Enhygromyxa sp.]